MTITPMLALKGDAIPNSGDYIAEPKCDGWRCIARRNEDGSVDMFARSGNKITQVPYVAQVLKECLPNATIVDGELIALGVDNHFKRTQEILKRRKEHDPIADGPPLTYVLFDALEIDGTNVMHEPLSTRRQMLKLLAKLCENQKSLRFTPVGITEELPCDDPNIDDWFAELVEVGYEGVVCKWLDSSYLPGSRSGSWIKVKSETEADVEVTGTYPPTPGSKYQGTAVGGITFHVTHEDGASYDGRCAGMNDDVREELLTDPDAYIGRIAVVRYASIGESGALRFPRVVRWRDPTDKASVADLTAVMPSNTNARVFLKRAMEAEERAEELEAENRELRIKLGAAAKVVGKPKRAASGGGSRGRNYDAMHSDKLSMAVISLRNGAGEAYEWVTSRGRDLAPEQERAEQAARARGLIAPQSVDP